MGFHPIFIPSLSTAAEPQRPLDPVRHLKTTLIRALGPAAQGSFCACKWCPTVRQCRRLLEPERRRTSNRSEWDESQRRASWRLIPDRRESAQALCVAPTSGETSVFAAHNSPGAPNLARRMRPSSIDP
jgi:hypothetical protein